MNLNSLKHKKNKKIPSVYKKDKYEKLKNKTKRRLNFFQKPIVYKKYLSIIEKVSKLKFLNSFNYIFQQRSSIFFKKIKFCHREISSKYTNLKTDCFDISSIRSKIENSLKIKTQNFSHKNF